MTDDLIPDIVKFVEEYCSAHDLRDIGEFLEKYYGHLFKVEDKPPRLSIDKE